MIRFIIQLILIAGIGMLVSYYIIPNILCWRENGAYSYADKVCTLGTVFVPDVPLEKPASTTPVVVEVKNVYKDLITIDTPSIGSVITSPVTITGSARGNWFFEASFPVIIVDWDGKIIGEGHAEAQSDWMTSEYVPYVATVTFLFPSEIPYARGSIILKNDNPSGLPENDDAFEVPIMFK